VLLGLLLELRAGFPVKPLGLLLEALPLPLTVTRSFTRRLPANELAIRRAVCFSLLVWTLPPSSIVLSLTFTLRLSLCNVGSFWSAFWIWLCRVAVSLTLTPVVAVEGAPAVPAAVVPTPALAPIAPVPAAAGELFAGLAAVAPVTPPVVVGVLLPD
jgi:hypothetical protein